MIVNKVAYATFLTGLGVYSHDVMSHESVMIMIMSTARMRKNMRAVCPDTSSAEGGPQPRDLAGTGAVECADGSRAGRGSCRRRAC